jgi:hypothetical protein
VKGAVFVFLPDSQNQFLLAANEAPGADFDFNVSTPAFNGEKASGTWTLRVLDYTSHVALIGIMRPCILGTILKTIKTIFSK